MPSLKSKAKKLALKTTITNKNSSDKSWSGKIIKNKKSMRVEVNSITGLLARCAALSE